MRYKTEARSIPLAAVVGIGGRERNRDAGRRAKDGDEHKKDKQILHHLLRSPASQPQKGPWEVRSPAGQIGALCQFDHSVGSRGARRLGEIRRASVNLSAALLTLCAKKYPRAWRGWSPLSRRPARRGAVGCPLGCRLFVTGTMPRDAPTASDILGALVGSRFCAAPHNQFRDLRQAEMPQIGRARRRGNAPQVKDA